MSLDGLFTYYRGRVGLREVLAALGIGPGDRVAVQAFTCRAVPDPVLSLGAEPVYVDVREAVLGMDPEDLRRKAGDRTRAIVVQHTFGLPAPVRPILEVARELDAPVIEDCCHALPRRGEERGLGTRGAAAFYSFEWGKPLVAGVGGAVRANREELRERLANAYGRLGLPPRRERAKIELQYALYRRLLTGRTYWPLRRLYHLLSRAGVAVGTFGREGQGAGGEDTAAVGGPHRGRTPEYGWRMAPRVEKRLGDLPGRVAEVAGDQTRVRHFYDEIMAAAGLDPFPGPPGGIEPLLRYPLRVDDKPGVLERAREAGIELSDMFETPVDPVPWSELDSVGYRPGSCPRAEAASRTVVSLPVHERVGERDLERAEHLVRDIAPMVSRWPTRG